jgi:hypothetical protein
MCADFQDYFLELPSTLEGFKEAKSPKRLPQFITDLKKVAKASKLPSLGDLASRLENDFKNINKGEGTYAQFKKDLLKLSHDSDAGGMNCEIVGVTDELKRQIEIAKKYCPDNYKGPKTGSPATSR